MENYILSEIVRETREKGNYNVPFDTLRPAFECDDKQGLCIKERLLFWAIKNQVLYVYREEDQKTVVRFFSRERREKRSSYEEY